MKTPTARAIHESMHADQNRFQTHMDVSHSTLLATTWPVMAAVGGNPRA